MTWIDEKTEKPVAISDAALAIYEKMKNVRCTCTPEIPPPDEGWGDWEQCAGCERWGDLNRQLLHMLGKAVPPYEYAVVPPPRGMAVEPKAAVARWRAFEEVLAGRPRQGAGMSRHTSNHGRATWHRSAAGEKMRRRSICLGK